MDTQRRTFMKLSTGAAVLAAAAHQAKAAEPPASGVVAPPPGADMLRLVTYAPDGKAARVGAVLADGQVGRSRRGRPGLGRHDAVVRSCQYAIADHPPGRKRWRRPDAWPTQGPRLPLSGRLLAPLPTPTRNVYAVGWNYLEHVAEGAFGKAPDLPKHPVFFTKAVGTGQRPL